MSIKEKRFTIKVYASDGTTIIKTYGAKSLANSPTFSSEMNGGFGECVVELNTPFDDFGEGLSVEFENIVRIYQFDENNTLGRLIYSGYISSYKPFISGSNQGVKVSLLGMVSLLSRAYYKNGSSFTVAHSAEDASDVMKAIINHFATINPNGSIHYDTAATTVDTVGVDVDYTFEEKTWREALDNIFSVVADGWWWVIDATGELYLKQKPATATHTFTIGKDIENLEADKSSEDVVNTVTVKYAGGLTETYSDATSIAKFGVREKIVEDTQIGDATTAAQRAQKEVNENKDEKIKATLTINSRYEIETIKVGDTCKIRNIKVGSTLFTDNMQIVKIRYEWDRVELQLEDVTNSFGNEIKNFVSA